ncbi:diguanylate cyclase (GGDEF) domain-containing protein [Parafrankia irregularis]|uniref:Diguanylate cyclase (GGDEF) domain-containing protein n=1 Tax=Parafrankia irregularis TaxID=795642 RepID=A0A0S4QEH6_9ACTN|nr:MULTISPECIES: GGDEF domain-containing protein [Parafrankia]MBE3199669.1 GGDEF domain-containing protein [Parafrankia sp. CH37]CUU53662.1 diguanylate cyclase (GGDEF) domain-containing protein [Parafrankia irregularis]
MGRRSLVRESAPAAPLTAVRRDIRLRAAVRPGDTVARLGGDEFAAIIEGATDPDALVARLMAELGRPCPVGGARRRVAASVGYAVTPQRSVSAQELLRSADQAMYQAKRHRRSRAGRGAISR